MQTDTIAAIATAMSSSGIGIIRISGSEAFAIIDQIFKPKNPEKKMAEVKTFTIHYGSIYDGDQFLDEVLVMIMRGPHTYTAEDTVEIDCHGGVLVMKKILETVIRHGARPAEPGEFTKRAFLNGRMDLSQAEAVMDLIDAKNDLALKTSLKQLKGAVKEKITEIRKEILYHTAFIETALDDPEHISLEGYEETLMASVKEQLKKLDQLIASSDNGRILKEGIKTVIVGKPNAGKSSLLNVLAGEERAIVTEIAGTTRDVLEEQIYLGGVSLNLLDTAGIRNTQDQVEKIGVSRAKEHALDADFILYVVDSSAALDESDEEIIAMLQDKKAAVLLNKSDLAAVTTEEMMKERLQKPVLSISAKEQKGMEELEALVKELFFQGDLSFNDELYITNIRHKTALMEARDSLRLVLESIAAGMPEDFYSIDLLSAYESLGSIIGEAMGEDLVNEIFSKFCMGK